MPLLVYAAKSNDCKGCEFKGKCISDKKTHRELSRKCLADYQEIGHSRIGTVAYDQILKRRQIVCEGNFGLQKRCHNLRFTRKRGIENVEEQCLLSASALNLKRLMKEIKGNTNPLAKAAKSLICKWICYLY